MAQLGKWLFPELSPNGRLIVVVGPMRYVCELLTISVVEAKVEVSERVDREEREERDEREAREEAEAEEAEATELCEATDWTD